MTEASYRWPSLDWQTPLVIKAAREAATADAELDALAKQRPSLWERRPELNDLRRAHFGPATAELIRSAT